MENLMRALQQMATREAIKKHDDDWNLRLHVSNWLFNFTTDRTRLESMSAKARKVELAKARLPAMINGRFARYGPQAVCRVMRRS